MRPYLRLLAPLAILAAFGCGGGSTGPSDNNNNPGNNPPPAPNTVKVGNPHNYTPAAITVSAGTMVTWNWDTCSSDSYGNNTCVDHSVTFDDGSATSSIQNKGSYSRTFNTMGDFPYHCMVHGSLMTGVVHVN